MEFNIFQNTWYQSSNDNHWDQWFNFFPKYYVFKSQIIVTGTTLYRFQGKCIRNLFGNSHGFQKHFQDVCELFFTDKEVFGERF